jgi:predicted nucleotide-binding protein
MASVKSKAPQSVDVKAKRVRVSQADVPAHSLDEALRVALAIFDNYGSAPTKPLEVAAAMNLTPTSSYFKMLTGAAIAYGLTLGGYNASEISLTPLAGRILSPLEDGDDVIAKREALLVPSIIGQFLKKYNNSPLPSDVIANNVLVSMGVPKERVETVRCLILDGAFSVGLLREIKQKKYVNLDGNSSTPLATPSTAVTELDRQVANVTSFVTEENDTEPKPAQRNPAALAHTAANRKVFITHGRNKDFVDPIKKLLTFGEMEAVVSVERQSVSQPVPDKVMNDMRDCGAAIIHVEGEMLLLDQEAKEHVVLNPNVLIEIGAAMALYGKRFILLVKDGTKLPSNLQGLYEVRYDGDVLDGNATIRLLEAINQLKSLVK